MRKTWGTANLLKVFDTELSARQTHQQSAGKWVGWRNLLTPTFQKENNQIKSFFYIVPSFFCLFVYFLTFWRQVRPRWGLLGGLPPCSFCMFDLLSEVGATWVPLVSQRASSVAIVLTLEPHERGFQGPFRARWLVPKIRWRVDSIDYWRSGRSDARSCKSVFWCALWR